MTDTKQNTKPEASGIEVLIGLISVFGTSFIIGKGIVDLLSKLNKKDEDRPRRYNAELEALRRIIREELL